VSALSAVLVPLALCAPFELGEPGEPGAVELAPLFRDGAVLQCEMPVRVWGAAEPGTRVDVSLAGQAVSGRADAEATEPEVAEASDVLAEAPVTPEHLRMLEALLFAAVEPLDEKSIAARLPEEANLPGLLAQLPWRSQRKQRSRILNGDSVAVFRLLHEMRRDDDRDAALRQRSDRAPERTPRQRVDAAGGLV